MRRRFVRGLVVLLLVAVCAIAIAPIRHAMLRGAGRMLIASDGIEPADLLAMDVESGEAGLLALSDWVRAGVGRTVDSASRKTAMMSWSVGVVTDSP